MLIVRGLTRACTNCSTVCTFQDLQGIYMLLRYSPSLQRFVRPELCGKVLSRELQMTAGSNKKPSFTPRHEWDKVSRDYSLIYASSLRHWISATNVGLSGLTASVCALSAYKVSSMNLEALLTTAGAFVCGVPFFITALTIGWTFLSRPVIIRIYCNAENGRFIAVRRNIFWQLKRINYTLKDISLKNGEKTAGSETWDSVSLSIKDTPVYLLSSDFVSLLFYNMHVNGKFHPENEKSQFVKEHFY